MKINQVLSLIIIFLLSGCSSAVTPTVNLTLSKPTPTLTLVPTHTLLPTLTPTIIPVKTAVTCQPASNPWTSLDTYEYHAGWYPNIDIARVCIFNGEISRGQAYKHQIAQNLVFCLIPGSMFRDAPNEGWYIVVSETSCDISSDDFVDFSGLVSPPWRGNRSLFVFGWEYRNEDNTEDIMVSPVSRFNFVFNRADHTQQQMQFNCQVGVNCPPVIRDIPRSRGILTITDMELGNLMPNSKAWIETMEFEVKIYLPAE